MTRKRIILTAAVTAAVTAILTLAVLLIIDTTKKPSFTVIDPREDRPHISMYKNLPPTMSYAAGMLLYSAAGDTDTKKIADETVRYTRFYKAPHLEKALCEYNAIQRGKVAAGSVIYIPHPLPSIMPDMRNRAKSPLIFTRGLYYTGPSAGSDKILKQMENYDKAGINTVVFDAKDVTGYVNYNSSVPDVLELKTSSHRSIEDIDKLIRELKSRNIYVIARIACFRDQLLAKAQPEWAIHSKRTGGLWNENTGEIWCDPTNIRLQDYNLQMAIELADKGVDEIQFDYIRFPTSGELSDARFAWSEGVTTNEKCIERFLSRAYKEISSRNVNLSIDVFGIVAWGHEKDIEKTGQRITLLSKWCDVISPMLYPSHFSDNFDGYAKPGDNPYYFINEGCKKFMAQSGKAAIRPWLQAFGWRVSNYSPDYIREQVRASNDAAAKGYLFWNAGNNYDYVFKALREMRPGRSEISLNDKKTKTGDKGTPREAL